jgi:hypothetical protein
VEIIRKLIIIYMKYELKKLRRTQNTKYVFLNGTGKDYPNYLVFTDNEDYRNKLHYSKELID